MTKAKKSDVQPEGAEPVKTQVTTTTVEHSSDSAGYHAAQLERLGAGACDVCGLPVDAKPEWTKTSSCKPKFHAEQAAQFGAGACTVCGQPVIN